MTIRTVVIQNICELNSAAINRLDVPPVVQYLDTGNITRNKIETTQKIDTGKESLPSRAQRRVKDKTIIYSTVRPEQEHFGFIENPPENLIVSTGFVTLDVVDEDIDPKFLYYSITRKEITRYLHTVAVNNVSSYPSIHPADLGKLRLRIPRNRHSQQQIAAVLSVLDAKIEINNRINAELEAMAKTLYDYWFVQFDFPNASGKPYKSSGGKMVWNAELKRNIPEGWESKNLADITPVSNESTNPFDFPDKEFKHLSIPSFDEKKTYAAEKGSEIQSSKFIVSAADILVSKLNPWFSRVVYATDESDLICSTEFVVWRPDPGIKNYLFMIARDAPFIRYCISSASSTSHSHRRVTPRVMMKYSVPYQNDIARQFSNEIEFNIKTTINNQRQNRYLVELRDWLLPMLMNGQVKVK
jgi:type I restriction enzyme S subunit